MQPIIYTHFIKASRIPFHFFSDQYQIEDLMYYLLCDGISDGMMRNKGYLLISDDVHEYLESILVKEDKDNIYDISEAMLKKIKNITEMYEFQYLKDYTGEILDVQYRYLRKEKFVHFYIKLES